MYSYNYKKRAVQEGWGGVKMCGLACFVRGGVGWDTVGCGQS